MDSNENTTFAVVIPTYAEAENLKWLVPDILDTYPGSCVVVVNDHSGDNTAVVMREFQSIYGLERIHFLERTGNSSYAQSLLEGLKYASGFNFDQIIQMDADGSHPTSEIKNLIATESDITIASRYIRGSKVINVPLMRRAISIFGNYYLSIRNPINIRDRTNGFRCFNRRAMLIIEKLESSENGFSIQIEILNKLIMSGLTVQEIGTEFKYRKIGESKFDFKKFLEAFREN